MNTPTEKAVVAGGCFWGMQDSNPASARRAFRARWLHRWHVISATYENHGTHAEAAGKALAENWHRRSGDLSPGYTQGR